MKISIIIPAYNEEKRILHTLEKYYTFFKEKFQDNFEIIVVPNNCSDHTFNIVKQFSMNHPQTKVFNLPNYSGKGGAVMKGFELAIGDYIGFTDADNSTNPENFYNLYTHIENSSGIIGSRKIKGAVVNPKRKLTQNISSFLFNKLIRILFGLKFLDTQCGAKLFKKRTAKFLTEHYSESGWAFDVDLLNLCKNNNFKIIEYPIFWTDSEGSKLSLTQGFTSVLKLIKYRITH